jgi:oligopeptide transport system substrate-binding protein
MFLQRKVLIIFGLLAINLLLSSCEKSTTQPPAETPKSPPYLRLPLAGSLATIDPGLIFEARHLEVIDQLFLGLTTFNPKTYEVVPQLARNWRVSDDGKVYTFYLRQDAKWSNGQPVTAHDIVWAIQRNIDHQTDSPYAYTLYILKNAAAIYQRKITDVTQIGVRAVDDYTIQFILTQPAGYFPSLTSLWTYRPLPRQLIQEQGANWTEPAHIQTNGPYTLTAWNKGKQLILKKNPYYYAAHDIKIPEVHYYILQESSLALAMYEKNELDMIGGEVHLPLPPLEISRIKSDTVLRRERKITPSLCTEWYGFNTQRFPTNNLLVRKAIAMALDKKTLLDVTIDPEAILARTFTPPPTFGAVAPEEEIGIFFNPKQAKMLLARAGYPGGEGLPSIILMYNNSKQHQKVAQAIKTILKYHLNIDIEIQPHDFLSYINKLSSPDKAHLFRAHWCADYPDAHRWLHEVFHPQEGINWIGWNQPEFVQVTEQAKQSMDIIERQQLYKRAEQILTQEEVAIIPLYFTNTQFLVKSRIKNWYPNAFGGQLIRFWSLEP